MSPSKVELVPVMAPRPPAPKRNFGFNRRRLALILLVIAAGAVLILSGTLALVGSTHHPAQPLPASATPMLAVTPATAHPGQVVLLHLGHFSPSGHVLLTRDIQQQVRTDAASSLILMDTQGNADVHVLVQDSWGSGLHVLVAEDVRTHFAASVDLSIAGDLTTLPPRLLVSSPDEPDGVKHPVNLGGGVQGFNSTQALLLVNSGGGWISWKAISDQPWLEVAPQQGIFQTNQSLFIAAARAHLEPGQYHGTITITSNTGAPAIIHVTMTTLPLPKLRTSLLEVEPPLFSFTSTDGGGDPSSQSMTLTNAGVQSLRWSVSASMPQNLSGQDMFGQDDLSWLQPAVSSGVIPVGARAQVQIRAHTQRLLPGVYTGLLVFSDGSNITQPVIVVVTVQPRCGIATSQGSAAFTFITDQHVTTMQQTQLLSVSTSPGCSDATNWMGFPQVSWLKLAPAGGQLQPGISALVYLQVNASSLAPGTYNSQVYFLTEMRSQVLSIQLVILPPTTTPRGNQPGGFPPVTATAGLSNTPAPGLTSTPTPLSTATPTPVPGSPTPVPTGTPGPQSCVLQVTPTRLTYVATLTQNPSGQSLTLTMSGQCAQSVNWHAVVDAASQSWLHLSAASGTIGRNGSTLIVQVNANGMLLGTYKGQITLTAEAVGIPLKGSPSNIAVTLTVIL